MKTDTMNSSTRLAERALRRAARKVLAGAVRDNHPVPLWDGNKVVWKIPKEEVEQMDALDTHSSCQRSRQSAQKSDFNNE